MEVDDIRNGQAGHDIIEISDDDEDGWVSEADSDVVEIAPVRAPASLNRRRRQNRSPDFLDIDSDGDMPMRDWELRNREPRQEYQQPPRNLFPEAEPEQRAVPVVQIPHYEPFLDLPDSPNRDQGIKRHRSQSPLGRNPAKRVLLDRPRVRFDPDLQWMDRDLDGPMFEPNLRDGQFNADDQLVPNGLQGNGAAAPADAAAFSKEACLTGLLVLFPDLSPDYVSELWQSRPAERSVEALANFILQEIDAGRPYTKTKKEVPASKQNQAGGSETEQEKKYMDPNRQRTSDTYYKQALTMLSFDFPSVPKKLIDEKYAASNYFLYPAYLALYEIERQWTATKPTYTKLKSTRRLPTYLSEADVDHRINGTSPHSFIDTPETVLCFQEYKDARAAKKRLQVKYELDEALAKAEKENEDQARALGAIDECACCFTEYALNRMVHCSNEDSIHFFCRTCAKTNAETEVGQGKYVLVCMSMDGCSAGFSLEQRDLFLDANLKIALERIETEHNLRMAGIENLESCPFCPYAAEYPPISETRIFHCVHPDCGLESCRLCKKVSHIPKTCQEFAKESSSDSLKRRLEDAMSEALVRKCNKCKTPFIKMEGCNKIVCSKCRNIQCYICSQDCTPGPDGSTYAHFNDRARGGKEGNCQLFDNTEQRHEDAVQAAQKAAIASIQAEHPEFTEEELKVTETAAAKEDRERRLRMGPGPAGMPYGVYEYGGMWAPRPNREPAAEQERFRRRLMALREQLNQLNAQQWAPALAGGDAPRMDYAAEVAQVDQQLAAFYQGRNLDGEVIRAVQGEIGRRNALIPPPDPVWNPEPWDAYLPGGGIRILHYVPENRPFVVQAPPPPPVVDPAKVLDKERKRAQDQALRAAYLRAPPEVQARRRDQMRRMMKDPTLDDAAVERAILRNVEEDVGVDQNVPAPPQHGVRDRMRVILDRLQGRREEPEPQPVPYGPDPGPHLVPDPPQRPVHPDANLRLQMRERAMQLVQELEAVQRQAAAGLGVLENPPQRPAGLDYGFDGQYWVPIRPGMVRNYWDDLRQGPRVGQGVPPLPPYPGDIAAVPANPVGLQPLHYDFPALFPLYARDAAQLQPPPPHYGLPQMPRNGREYRQEVLARPGPPRDGVNVAIRRGLAPIQPVEPPRLYLPGQLPLPARPAPVPVPRPRVKGRPLRFVGVEQRAQNPPAPAQPPNGAAEPDQRQTRAGRAATRAAAPAARRAAAIVQAAIRQGAVAPRVGRENAPQLRGGQDNAPPVVADRRLRRPIRAINLADSPPPINRERLRREVDFLRVPERRGDLDLRRRPKFFSETESEDDEDNYVRLPLNVRGGAAEPRRRGPESPAYERYHPDGRRRSAIIIWNIPERLREGHRAATSGPPGGAAAVPDQDAMDVDLPPALPLAADRPAERVDWRDLMDYPTDPWESASGSDDFASDEAELGVMSSSPPRRGEGSDDDERPAKRQRTAARSPRSDAADTGIPSSPPMRLENAMRRVSIQDEAAAQVERGEAEEAGSEGAVMDSDEWVDEP